MQIADVVMELDGDELVVTGRRIVANSAPYTMSEPVLQRFPSHCVCGVPNRVHPVWLEVEACGNECFA